MSEELRERAVNLHAQADRLTRLSDEDYSLRQVVIMVRELAALIRDSQTSEADAALLRERGFPNLAERLDGGR